jgi:hypothetical protein
MLFSEMVKIFICMFVLADVSVRMSQDEDDAWLHRGHLTRNSNNLSYSYQIVITL